VDEIMALPVGANGDAYHMYPIYTSGGGYLFGKTAGGDYDPKDLGRWATPSTCPTTRPTSSWPASSAPRR
jgi:hypothetical protein